MMKLKKGSIVCKVHSEIRKQQFVNGELIRKDRTSLNEKKGGDVFYNIIDRHSIGRRGSVRTCMAEGRRHGRAGGRSGNR